MIWKWHVNADDGWKWISLLVWEKATKAGCIEKPQLS